MSGSRHETSELMMPHHANNLGHVFGGVMLSMMDRTAAVAAFRHCRKNVVTASIDRVDFREPIHVGDLVVMQASVNYVGRTSMEVGVRVEAEELLTGRRRHTNSCYLTFVAVDRAKQQPAELIAGKDIQKISTFIYYRGDQELGRIVERTQSPLFEDDLLTSVASPER